MDVFHRFRSCIFVGATWLASTGTVLAQADIIAVTFDFQNSPVGLIDRSTGITQPIGLSGFARLNSLAIDSMGTLFSVGGTAGNQLLTINPNSGAGTAGPVLNVADIRAMAFSPTDQLFAVQEDGIGDRLLTIDINSGVATTIGRMAYAGVQGLEFAPDGTLYGWDVGTGSGIGAGLLRIDPLTAHAVDVNPLVEGRGTVQTLAFAPDGTLYGAGNGLFTIGTLTGQQTLIGGNFSDVRGIAVVPEPGTAALLISGLLLFGAWVRRSSIRSAFGSLLATAKPGRWRNPQVDSAATR